MQRSKLLMKKRKCAKCGAGLTNEDVMKIGFEDGSWQVIPLPICPDCFAKRMVEQALMHATSKKEQRATVAFRGLEVAELENV